MSRRILVSAPGKVIIHGEHAVVFGKKALAASLGLRTELSLFEADDGIVLLQLPDIGITASWQIDELNSFPFPAEDFEEPKEAKINVLAGLKKLARLDEGTTETKKLALVAFLYLFYGIAVKSRGQSVPSLHLEASSLLPTGAGLGSSAAYSVCLAAGLLIYARHIPAGGDEKHSWTEYELSLVNRWAFVAEKIFHGSPSGIDNSVSTYGNALCFKSGKIIPLHRMPNLRIILVNTKIPRSTKNLVERVRKKHDKYPEIVKPILDSIEGITSEFETILNQELTKRSREEIHKTMEDLIDMNQQLLVFLGVSHPALDNICQITLRHRLHSKLTGAGGGGCAMTLIPNGFPGEIMEKTIAELTAQGYDCFETSVGGPGVTASIQT